MGIVIYHNIHVYPKDYHLYIIITVSVPIACYIVYKWSCNSHMIYLMWVHDEFVITAGTEMCFFSRFWWFIVLYNSKWKLTKRASLTIVIIHWWINIMRFYLKNWGSSVSFRRNTNLGAVVKIHNYMVINTIITKEKISLTYWEWVTM